MLLCVFFCLFFLNHTLSLPYHTPPQNNSFHGQEINKPVLPVNHRGRPVLRQGFASRWVAVPGLRRAAAGAGRALRAADAVGRAAVLRGGLGLLDVLCAGCLT